MAHLTAADLVESGALPPRTLEACVECIRDCRTVMVTGVAGSGKTTLLRALAGLLPDDETRLVFDSARALGLQGPQYEHVDVRGVDLMQSPGDTVAAALDCAPRVLVIDDLCPPEAGLLLRALGSGCHAGSLLALGAESVEAALRRLAAWSALDGLSRQEACFGVAAGIDLGVGLFRETWGHRVAEVAFVEAAQQGWTLRPA